MSTNDKLNKGFQNIAQTSDARSNSEELLSRFTSVAAEKSLQAAKVVGDLKGSWIQSSSISNQVSEGTLSLSPISESERNYALGLPGMPEVNFRPYDWGTNRFGSKGPSLVGHPISFEVVGPTAKSPYLDIQWVVTNNSGSSDGDYLTIDTQSVLSPPAGPANDPIATTITGIYGLYNLNNFPGGLYLIINQTGEAGNYLGSPGGLSDGYVYDLSGSRTPLVAQTPYSKFEVFRIKAIAGDQIELEPSKRLEDYFNIEVLPDESLVRSITLLAPYASRMAAIPGTGGVGSESVFAILPPIKSANADFMPPYFGDNAGDGSWLRSGFDRLGSTKIGAGAYYNEKVALPCGKRLKTYFAQLRNTTDAESGLIFPLPVGEWAIRVPEVEASSDDIGRVIHIDEIYKSHTAMAGSLQQVPLNDFSGNGTYNVNSLLGFFEISNVRVDTPYSDYVLRRITEVDPISGKLTYGDYEGFITDATLTSPLGAHWDLKISVYDSIANFFAKKRVDLEELEKTVLTNIINPLWVNDSSQGEGLGTSRPDLATFNTKLNENPGNLLDLGFRPVIFPAKAGSTPGTVIPDWANPITSNQVILDPSVSEQQFIEIDYASGLIRLSHTPVPGPGCDIAPSGIITSATENPRNEIVLFISCVPFSREPEQTKAGLKVFTQNDPDGIEGGFNSKKVYPLKAYLDGSQLTYTLSGNNLDFYLALEPRQEEIPETGYFSIIERSKLNSSNRTSTHITYGYSKLNYSTDSVTGFDYIHLQGCFGGSGSTDTFSTDGEYVAVFRKEVLTPTNSDTLPDSSNLAKDILYGYNKNNSTLLVSDGKIVTNSSGQTTLTFPEFVSQKEVNRNLLANGWVSGASISYADLLATISEGVFILNGNYVIVPQTTLTLPDASTRFINLKYDTINSVDKVKQPYYALTSSVAGTGNFPPLYQVTTLGGAVLGTPLDLRKRIIPANEPFYVTVGLKSSGYGSDFVSNFDTIGDAVKYLNLLNTTFPAKTYQIIVVGDCLETETITLFDGLSILGVEGFEKNTISFNFNDKPLFDLNESNHITLKDLNIVNDPTSLTTPNSSNTNACIFRGGSSNLNLKNIKIDGSSKISYGFYMEDPTLTGENSTNINISDCYWVNCIRNAILNPQTSKITNVIVHNCRFDGGASYLTTVSAGIAFSSLTSVGGVSQFLTIESCVIENYYSGIILATNKTIVSKCHVTTENRGIFLLDASNSEISDDWTYISESTFISDLNASFYKSKVSIDRCIFEFAPLTANPYVFEIPNNDSYFRISDSEFKGGLSYITSENIIFTNCFFEDVINVTTSSNCFFDYCVFAEAPSSAAGSSNLSFYGCTFEKDLSLVSSHCYIGFCYITGNSVGKPGLELDGSDLTVEHNLFENGSIFVGGSILSSKLTITNNTLTDLGSLATAAQMNISVNTGACIGHISGNSVGREGSIDADNMTLDSNKFFTDLIVTGDYTKVTNNTIGLTLTVDTDAEGSEVSGNIVRTIVSDANKVRIVHNEAWLINVTGNNNVVTNNIVYDTSVPDYGDIYISGTGYILMGNIFKELRTSAAFATPDPDILNGIVVGNKVTSGTIFGAAVTGSAKDNNV